MNHINLDTVNSWKFPGGEVGVKLAPLEKESTKIYARLRNSDDVMKLVMVNDIADQLYGKVKCYGKQLVMPYVPYGRQDRVCSEGESFSLRAFASLINGMGFDKVTVYDMHSLVTKQLIDNCVNISNVAFVLWAMDKLRLEKPVLIAPDQGAIPRMTELLKYISAPLLNAEKQRDMDTGKIIKYSFEPSVEGEDCIVVDDICDGGATFISLAKLLREKGARSIHLLVSHGIFSKGLDVLYRAGIDSVWTTDSYYRDGENLGLDRGGYVYSLCNEI